MVETTAKLCTLGAGMLVGTNKPVGTKSGACMHA